MTVYRRGDQGFVIEQYKGLEATAPLGEIGAAVALGDLYQRIEFPAAPDR